MFHPVRVFTVAALAAVLSVTFADLLFGGEEVSPGEKRIIEELTALRKSIEKLEKRIQALEKILVRPKPVEGVGTLAPLIPTPNPFPGFRRVRPGPDAPPLPAGATKEQVRGYVKAVKDGSRGRTSWSSTDKEVFWYKAVGPEHVDVLIDALEPWGLGHSNFHLLEAIVSMVDERHRDLIIEQLPIHKDLVKAVLRNRWELHARSVLLAELRAGPRNLGIEWIEAVANLRESGTYPMLLEYFMKSRSPAHVYHALRNIPDLPRRDLDLAVESAWESRGSNGHLASYGVDALARIAARHGIVNALGHIIGLLGTVDDSRWFAHTGLREYVLSLVPARGTNAEIQAWFDAHRDELKYDSVRERYIIPKPGGGNDGDEGDEGF